MRQLTCLYSSSSQPFYTSSHVNSGWMKILQYSGASYTASKNAIGNIGTTTVSSTAKLSDTDINYLAGEKIYKYMSTRTTSPYRYAYVKSTAAFDDSANSQGFNSGTRFVCQVDSLAQCTFRQTSIAFMDTYGYSDDAYNAPYSNDCNRIFSDYPGWVLIYIFIFLFIYFNFYTCVNLY